MQQTGSRTSRKLPGMALGAVVSLAAIALVFSQIDFGQFLTHMEQADFRYFVVLLGAYPIFCAPRTWRFAALLNDPPPFGRLFHIININYILNVTLPLRAGELARVVLLSREPGQSAGAGLSGLALERLFDMMAALLAVGLGLAMLPENASLPQETTSTLGALIVITIAGGGAVVLLPKSHPLIERLVRLITKPLPEKASGILMTFTTDTLKGLERISNPRRLITSLAWTFLLWAGYAAFFFAGLSAFMPGPAPLGVTLLTLGFVALGAAAPSLPGAVGVYQAAAVLALTTAGYTGELAASIAWGIWIPQMIMVVIVGMISLWALGLSLTQVAADTKLAPKN